MTDPTVGHASYYPVMLDVSERPCLVVGGGPVAARKARGLLECGASVTVIAPLLSDEMESLSLRLHAVERRPYRAGRRVGLSARRDRHGNARRSTPRCSATAKRPASG